LPYNILKKLYQYGFPYRKLHLKDPKAYWAALKFPYYLLTNISKYGFPYISRKQRKQRSWMESFGWPIDSFEEFIKAYCDEEYPWMIKQQKNFLFFQIFDDQGECCPHFLLRNECLDEGLKVICKPFNIIPKCSDVRIRSSRGSGGDDYKKYYTRSLRSLVEKKCSRELEAFGYSFDGHDGRTIIDTSSIRYNPHADMLTLKCKNSRGKTSKIFDGDYGNKHKDRYGGGVKYV